MNEGGKKDDDDVEHDLATLFESDEGSGEKRDRFGRGEDGRKRSVVTLLPRLTLASALTVAHLKALRPGPKQAGAVILAVPSVGWVDPVAAAAAAFGPWTVTIHPNEPPRYNKKPDRGADVAEALALGNRVLGVSPGSGSLASGGPGRRRRSEDRRRDPGERRARRADRRGDFPPSP